MVFWLARWVLDLKVGGSTPSPCHRAVSLEKKLYHTGHARCINGYRLHTAGGNPAMG